MRALSILCVVLYCGSGAAAEKNYHLRGSLDNSRIQFEQKKSGHVAFMGGSITEMNGYRPMVSERLQKRFPDTKFTFTSAGISSTCSTTGAFRLASDILATGPVDLFFVEFAVNDDQDAGHAKRECIRGLEGIVRHLREHNPHADIMVTFFVNEGMLATFREGKTPLTIDAHGAVAEHYQLPTINLAKEVSSQIESGKLTWKQYGGVHPAPFGNAICAQMIDDLLTEAWTKPLPSSAAKSAHASPAPLDELSYVKGRFIDPADAKIVSGWKIETPDWKTLKGSSRPRFANMKMLCADQPGAELTLDFSGTAIGAFVVAGPDAGELEASVDGGPVKLVNLYHRFSAGLHYPRTVMLATDLPPGRHALKLRTSSETKSSGHAVRIMQFGAN